MGVSGDPGGMGCWQPLGGDHQNLPSTPLTPEPLGTWGCGQSWYECPYFLAVETDLVKLGKNAGRIPGSWQPTQGSLLAFPPR